MDKQLSKSDSTASMLYQKGELLIKLAEKKEVGSRLSTYQQAHTTLMLSAQKYEQAYTNTDQNKASELLNVSWSNEHNKGVQITQDDSVLASDYYKRAGDHFHNATVIIPDSATSYKLGAQAYYHSQQPEKAIALLEEAQKQIDRPPIPVLEQLGYLYLQNDQPQKAVRIYQQAVSISDQNTNLIHGLSNAYIANKQHQQAIQLLESLVEQKSNNIIYKQSLATELYHIGSQQMDNLKKKQSKLTENNFNSVDSLFQRAHTLFNKLLEDNPQNINIKQQAAQFYLNSASVYQQVQSIATGDLASTVQKRMKEFLTESLPLYKALTEKHPKNKTFWRNLYQTYSYLGMKEEAQNIKSNF
ncbi:tetratricopeptide repeat protein [Fodinibius salinus]|uniref:tetratricopeptide repeat protein n=1 Tax=Fodinibius salinus TaxID=860790 RepID=UPI0014781F92|nr:tetratricopeptide repeat protein [Fodinibius salinus]